ncbi:MAG: family 20 glycosylhydrolase [Planctomycetes bacterium]|nr:family 20 glycosylhydrolase [Planctomycetota bacterium]
MPGLTVFPRVRKAEYTGGRLACRAGFRLCGTRFEKLDPRSVLGLKTADDGITVMLRTETMAQENYRLQIAGDGVVLESSDEAGALQGLRTIAYLASRGDLPVGTIEDGPDLEIRAYHLDLKCQLMSRSYLYELTDKLAAMRYNTIVVEYEDKFPYSEAVRPRHAESWAPGDARHYDDYCRARGMEVIPLIQSLGHLEFLTPFHGDLAETAAMLCPLKSESAELVERMADEVLDAHPSARFLHVGGDEAWDLGTCPACRDAVEREGEGPVFGRHMEKILNHVLQRGVRPMMWADMPLSHTEAFEYIDKAVVLVDWDYWSYGEEVDMVHVWGHGRTLNEDRQDIPQEKIEPFAETAEDVVNGCWTEGFAFTEYLREQGYDVLTASAVRSSGDPYTHPNLKFHLPNVWAAARAAVEDGALGSLVTSWAVRHVFPELTMMGIAAGAEAMWQARIADARWLVDFPARFGEVFLGDRAAGMAEYELSMPGLVYDQAEMERTSDEAAEWRAKPLDARISGKMSGYPQPAAAAMTQRMSALDRGSRALREVRPDGAGRIHVELYTLAADEAVLKLWLVRVLARLARQPRDETAFGMLHDIHAGLMELKERARVKWERYLSAGALRAEMEMRFSEEERLIRKALHGG